MVSCVCTCVCVCVCVRVYVCVYATYTTPYHSLTRSLTHSLAHSLAHSLTHSLTHSLDTDSNLTFYCFCRISTKPDVAMVTPLYEDKAKTCSRQAIVTAVSQDPKREKSIILADEQGTNVYTCIMLPCAMIATIRLSSST